MVNEDRASPEAQSAQEIRYEKQLRERGITNRSPVEF